MADVVKLCVCISPWALYKTAGNVFIVLSELALFSKLSVVVAWICYNVLGIIMEMIDHRFKDPVFWHVGRDGISIERHRNKVWCGRTEKIDGIALDPSPIPGVPSLRISVHVSEMLRHNAFFPILLMPQRTLCSKHRFIHGADLRIGNAIYNQCLAQGPNLFLDRGGKKIWGVFPMFSGKATMETRSTFESLDSVGGIGATP